MVNTASAATTVDRWLRSQSSRSARLYVRWYNQVDIASVSTRTSRMLPHELRKKPSVLSIHNK